MSICQTLRSTPALPHLSLHSIHPPKADFSHQVYSRLSKAALIFAIINNVLWRMCAHLRLSWERGEQCVYFCCRDLVRNITWTTDYQTELILIQTSHICHWNHIDCPAVPPREPIEAESFPKSVFKFYIYRHGLHRLSVFLPPVRMYLCV